jgi:hypothetical protein
MATAAKTMNSLKAFWIMRPARHIDVVNKV